MTTTVQAIGNFFVLSAILPLGLFIYRYWRYSDWRRDILGVSLMTQKITMTLLMLFIIISLGVEIFLGHWEGREWVRLLFFGIVIATFWNDYIQLIRIQRELDRAKPVGMRKRRFKK
jgi:hypothetical protein